MPTIEIASINSPGLGLKQEEFAFAVIEENKIVSHRGLFYDLLRQEDGVIVHIGNPDFRYNKEDGFFAGKLIEWDFDTSETLIPILNEYNPTDYRGATRQFRFKFLQQYKPDLDKSLKIALEHSSIKRVCFLTDYQFGPENANTEIIYTISDFWMEHDKEGLQFNTMYEMYGK